MPELGLDRAVLETLALRPLTEQALACILDEPKPTVGASLRRLVARHAVRPAPRDWHPVVRWQPAEGGL